MSNKEEMNNFAQHLSSTPRPILNSHYSNSVPTTPYSRARKHSFGARSRSPNRPDRDISPRSLHSETENGPRSRPKAPSITGCKFETGMAFSRRRIPYSIGGDMLERAKNVPKKFLNPEEEGKLSGDMRELYDRILPSEESDDRRSRFVQKLEVILNKQWPGNDVKIHVFGSSGNMLCTSDSDVDICVTTPMKSLERVCLLAKALADHGMERVVCVPHAKVPIVKFWDPELQLACDMNVNNTLALENTRMIKTYVEIDERVRPLAMIIKQWTKRRILNDAALGGTLSSYTWICMILNFLQTRNPPILPSLHKKPHLRKPGNDGKTAGFDDNIERLRGFGQGNKETLGELLFHFYRRYAHDLEYEKSVVSVREGRVISKEAKKWHLMQNNRLCVEEPFNIERNLGNTADDISFRGIHLELRRAFDLLSEAKLDQCLEQYEFPIIEERIWEKPPSRPPPVLSRSRSVSQSSRGNKSGYGNRGGGRHGQYNRTANAGRRASSAAAMNKFPGPQAGAQVYSGSDYVPRASTLEDSIQQLRLNEYFMNKQAELQAQEQELRFRQMRMHYDAHIQAQESSDGLPSSRLPLRDQSHRLPTSTQVPLSAPLRGAQYFHPFMYPQVSGTPHQSVHTQPSSPSLRPVQPDLRRGVHRSSAADNASSASLRSHSQPARPLPLGFSLQNMPPLPLDNHSLLQFQQIRQQQLYNEIAIAHNNGIRHPEAQIYHEQRRPSVGSTFEESVPKEYVGYWVNDSPPSRPHREDSRLAPLPAYQELHPRVRGVPQSFSRLRNSSRSPSPSPILPFRERSFSIRSASSAPVGPPRYERVPGSGSGMRKSGPIIANGTDGWLMSDYAPMMDSSSHTTTISEATSNSDEQPYETPVTADVDSQGPHQGLENGFALDNNHQYFHAQQTAESRFTLHTRNEINEPITRHASTQANEFAMSPDTMKRSPNAYGIAGGLGIQFGEYEVSHPPPKLEGISVHETAQTIPTAPKANANPATSINGQYQQAPVPVPLLSPVREVRTPSPSARRRERISAEIPQSFKRLNVAKDMRIPPFDELLRAKKEKENTTLSPKPDRKLSPTPAESSRMNHMSQIPNMNHVQQSPKAFPQQVQVNGGWQQQSSKKIRRNKSRPSSGQYMAGEPMPVNEAERKGG